MPPQVDINLLAVFVAAIVSMVLGALWYSPPVFGRMWMELSGIKEETMQEMRRKGLGKSYAVSFAGTLVMSYVLAHFVVYTQSTAITQGAQTGIWLWLGFIVPVLLGTVLWEGKPVKLYALNIAYQLVSLAIMGGILAAWR